MVTIKRYDAKTNELVLDTSNVDFTESSTEKSLQDFNPKVPVPGMVQDGKAVSLTLNLSIPNPKFVKGK